MLRFVFGTLMLPIRTSLLMLCRFSRFMGVWWKMWLGIKGMSTCLVLLVMISTCFESTKNVLVAASYIHPKHREYVKYTSDLTTVHPRILLSGPAGSEIYQEMLAKALAQYFGEKLLIFESHHFLGCLSSKEAEQLKDGPNVEKSSSKRTSIPSDLGKSLNPLAAEADMSSTSTAPSSCGHESQPKTEADTIPSSGSSKNQMFKIGPRETADKHHVNNELRMLEHFGC